MTTYLDVAKMLKEYAPKGRVTVEVPGHDPMIMTLGDGGGLTVHHGEKKAYDVTFDNDKPIIASRDLWADCSAKCGDKLLCMDLCMRGM